jgi:hypothetical protein
MLVVGNMYKDEAITLAKMTEELIPGSPLPGVGPVDLSLRLPEGASRVRVAVPSITRSIYQAPIMFGRPRCPTPMSLTPL